MPKVNLKKGRTKSYEDKLRERQERMTVIDRPEVVFMPGEELSDNDDEDAPLEVQTKREVLPLVDEEPELPEIRIQPKKPEKKKEKIKKVGEGEYALKVDNSIKLKIKAPKVNKRPPKNTVSFREKLLTTSTKQKRLKSSGPPSRHVEKWARRRP